MVSVVVGCTFIILVVMMRRGGVGVARGGEVVDLKRFTGHCSLTRKERTFSCKCSRIKNTKTLAVKLKVPASISAFETI